MLDIFVKRKKIVLDFFTIIPQVYEDGRPVQAVKVLPDWFVGSKMKRMQKEARDNNSVTIRKCPGLIDLYTKSIALTSWFNCEIDISPHGEVAVQQGKYGAGAQFTSHPTDQFEPFVEHTHSTNIKLEFPWQCKCNKNISFMLTEPTWHSYEMYNRVTVLPGIVAAAHVSQFNINFITRPSNAIRRVAFHPGDPLALLTPLTEDKVEIKTHLITETEAHKLDMFRPMYGITRPAEHRQLEEFIEHTDQVYDKQYHDSIVSKLKRIHNEDKK